MQAIIMAAGKGVRMLPLTENTPKSLLKISGTAILERTINELPDQVDEVIIVIGYLSEQIREHFKNSDKKISFVEDKEMRGTGFAVSLCKDLIKGDFLVLNGDDLYKKSDLENLMSSGGVAFLAKDVSQEPGFPDQFMRFGKIVVDSENSFVRLDSTPIDFSPPFYSLMGAYRFTKDLFDYPLVQLKNGEYGLPHTMFQMIDKHKIKVVPANFWLPIGFPEDLKKAEEFLEKNESAN